MNYKQTQIAISQAKTFFQQQLEANLNLTLVTGPIMLDPATGLNDHLADNYQAVSFYAEALDKELEVVQSLAKWKRYALKKYEYQLHEGIYVDMKAIRSHESLDHLHSLFVDQWDWEVIISKNERTINKLQAMVRKIYEVILHTHNYLNRLYPQLQNKLPEEVVFFESQTLENDYPKEDFETITQKVVQKHKAVFIMQIGKKLASGRIFDGRSAEYDDWELNGDLFLWSDVLAQAIEISSMGIRVDAASLIKQTQIDPKQKNLNPYFQAVLNDELDATIGGGIGQSRLIMFLLEKQHIGQIQATTWDANTLKTTKKAGINLL